MRSLYLVLVGMAAAFAPVRQVGASVIHVVPDSALVGQGQYTLNTYGQAETTPGTLALDLNGDGITDLFVVSDEELTSTSYAFGGQIYVIGPAPHDAPAVVAEYFVGQANSAVAPLASGTLIGPSSQFDTAANVINDAFRLPPHTEADPAWIDWQEHDIGIAFHVDGLTHYGWVGLVVGQTAPSPTGSSAVLVPYHVSVREWAYESQAGVPIVADAVPEPGWAVMFAMAVFPLLIMRTRPAI